MTNNFNLNFLAEFITGLCKKCLEFEVDEINDFEERRDRLKFIYFEAIGLFFLLPLANLREGKIFSGPGKSASDENAIFKLSGLSRNSKCGIDFACLRS